MTNSWITLSAGAVEYLQHFYTFPPHSNKATYWLWVATYIAWRQDSGSRAVIDTGTKLSCDLQHSTLVIP